MSKKIKIVVVGDTHVGSIYGLAHPSAVAQHRNNAFLQWVFECWTDFCRKHENPEYLVLMGDLADGSQVMTLGVDALFTDTDEQVNVAEFLFRMLIGKETKIFGVNGSGYHGGERQGTNIDRRIIEALNGEYKGNIFEFEVSGTNEKIQVAHGGAGSAIVGLHAYILREILLSKSDAQKRKAQGATILLRGHQHRMFMVQDDAGVYGVLNGCWQYTTPFMAKKSANVSPSIGATIIEIEGKTTKIYREEYPIPEYVRQAMTGHEVLSLKRIREEKKKNLQVLKDTLKGRKL